MNFLYKSVISSDEPGVPFVGENLSGDFAEDEDGNVQITIGRAGTNDM